MDFLGYERTNGTVGTRNYVLVLPTVNCINDVAYQLAAGVPGVKSIEHLTNCGHREDTPRTRRALAGMAKNPNIYAALFVGIGCEPIDPEELAEEVKAFGKPALGLSVKSVGDIEVLLEKGHAFLLEQQAAAEKCVRVPCDISNLFVGTKCGGSGSLSALSNNPAIGKAVDKLISLGGSAAFSETCETLGVEHILKRRMQEPADFEKFCAYTDRIKRDMNYHKIDLIGSEPTPGNIASGLSTIEEKSLGAIMKGGTTPIVEVLDFCEMPTRGHGLYFIDSSALGDAVLLSAMAAGSQVGIFSVASGLPARFGCLPSSSAGIETYPTIKVLGSYADRDQAKYFDAFVGDFLAEKISLDEAGDIVFNAILAAASGRPTYTEEHNKYHAALDFYKQGLVI